ncbi:hypothetical protein IMG5_156340, partial [Ichthyophthirius multifiliis]
PHSQRQRQSTYTFKMLSCVQKYQMNTNSINKYNKTIFPFIKSIKNNNQIHKCVKQSTKQLIKKLIGQTFSQKNSPKSLFSKRQNDTKKNRKQNNERNILIFQRNSYFLDI